MSYSNINVYTNFSTFSWVCPRVTPYLVTSTCHVCAGDESELPVGSSVGTSYSPKSGTGIQGCFSLHVLNYMAGLA